MSKLLYQLPNKSSSVKSGYGWSKWFFLLVLLMAVGILGAELVQPRIWQDYYMRMNYRPDEQIGQLVSKLNFSPRGKEVFFATNPVVSGPEDFNQQCNRHEATVSILGCYDDQNIYIYRVTESKLSGVMETTAAHELLHAAYARLNRFERPKVDELIMANYASLKTSELEERLDYYRRVDPASITNELHSILGTEFTKLSPELENYYQKYFTSRAQIVEFYQNYHQQFVALSSRANELKTNIEAMLPKITTSQVQYEVRLKQLNQEIDLFNQRADGGYYSSQSQFQFDRQKLMKKIKSVETERQQINQLIDEYNSLIEEYNNNATQYQKLNQSIDSLMATPSL